jgi:hypothetical protein
MAGRTTRLLLVASAVLCLTAGPGFSQWLQHRSAGLPRTADGRPDLNAPAPRAADGHPDLSGIWRVVAGEPARFARPEQVPFQPWAREFQKQVADSLSLGRTSERCLPSGIPQQMLVAGLPFKIVQTPGLVLTLFEEFIDYRQVFTDGRALPVVNNPSWFGYSVGQWEGGTLVVSSTGFTNQPWLTNDGYPRTEQLRMTERYRRISVGGMDVQFTFDDPGAYTKPWTASMRFELVPDTELLEAVCENEKFVSRVTGLNSSKPLR